MHPAYACVGVDWKAYSKYLEKQTMNKDHIERTKRMIEVMQAYVDGEEIESRYYGEWAVCPNPIFQWHMDLNYRVAKTPDSINWHHVAPEFKWMARDKEGYGYLYNTRPYLGELTWHGYGGKITKPENYASYKRGTCDWKDSLVIRPGCE